MIRRVTEFGRRDLNSGRIQVNRTSTTRFSYVFKERTSLQSLETTFIGTVETFRLVAYSEVLSMTNPSHYQLASSPTCDSAL